MIQGRMNPSVLTVEQGAVRLRVIVREPSQVARHTSRAAPLLLIHGSTTDASLWNDTQDELGRDRPLYLLNRRGRGGSTDESDYSVDKEGQDIEATLAAIADHHAAHHRGSSLIDVVAHSFGAMCLLTTLASSTRYIGSLVLYEPPLLPAAVLPDPSFVTAMRENILAGRNEVVVEAFFRTIERLNDRQLARLRSMPSWPMRVAAAPTIPRELEAVARYQVPTFVAPAFEQRVLFLVGGLSAPVIADATNVIAARFHHPQKATLPGQRHGAMNSAPALFVDTLRAFLT